MLFRSATALRLMAPAVEHIDTMVEVRGAPAPAFANQALAEEFGYVYEAIPGGPTSTVTIIDGEFPAPMTHADTTVARARA